MMKKKRNEAQSQLTNILFIKYSLSAGGAEKQLMLISNSLVDHGLNIAICYKRSDQHFIEKFDERVELIMLPSDSFIKNTLFIYRLVKDRNIQIIHTWELISVLFGFYSHVFTSAKLINGSLRSAPSEYIFAKYYKMRLQRIFARINYYMGLPIISNSKAGFVSYKTPYNKKNTCVLYNGYVIEKEQIPEASPNEVMKIGMLANMRWKKDFRTLIRAGLELLEKKYKLEFYFIGDGEDRPVFEEIVRNSSYSSNFIFTGHVKNPEFYIHKCDICVLTNDISGEGISNSIMEYMAHKKPVIATDMGGNPELVIHDKTGFLIGAEDVEALCNRLIELIENPDLRVQMGNNGYEHLRENFSIEKMTDNISQFYRSIL